MVDSQPDSFVSDDSEDYGTWCTWSDINECEGDYARFRPDVDCGGWSRHPSGECCFSERFGGVGG